MSDELFVVRSKRSGEVLTIPLPHITCEHFVGDQYWRDPKQVEIVTAREGLNSPRQRGDSVSARDLWTGDIIANLGIVDGTLRVGVFVIVNVRGTQWQLSIGKGDVVHRDVVFHEADTIILDVP